jgi:hypothetical protein
MVDLSHLRNNRKVITGTLAGLAVVAISVGVGVGVTRGKKGAGDLPIDVDSVSTVADIGIEPSGIEPTATEPFTGKESFLRADGFDRDTVDEIPEADAMDEADEFDRDILDENPEADGEDELDRTPRIYVDYSRNWGGRPRCGSWSSSKSGKGSNGSGKSASKGRRQCKFIRLDVPLCHSTTHSLIHSFTHSLIHSFTHSLIHSLTHSLTTL